MAPSIQCTQVPFVANLYLHRGWKTNCSRTFSGCETRLSVLRVHMVRRSTGSSSGVKLKILMKKRHGGRERPLPTLESQESPLLHLLKKQLGFLEQWVPNLADHCHHQCCKNVVKIYIPGLHLRDSKSVGPGARLGTLSLTNAPGRSSGGCFTDQCLGISA